MNRYLVEVPPGYRCPFCPDHRDDAFVTTPLLAQPICEGCATETDPYARAKSSPSDRSIPRIGQAPGIPWKEWRIPLLRTELLFWQAIRDNPDHQSYRAMPHWPPKEALLFVRGTVQELEKTLRAAQSPFPE